MAISGGDGSIILTTKVDESGLKRGILSMKSGARSLTSTFSKLGGVIGAAFSISTIVRFSNEASKMASNTEASIQRLIDIYGEASEVVGDFIDANAHALGMSRSAATEFSAVYGNLFSVWADQETNAKLTNQYLNATAVVASKTGRTMEDVQERIRSGLLGNTEAVEDLGIFVNVKTIEMTEAFKRIADGRSWAQLNAYEQSQVRTLAILEQATAKYGNQVAQTSTLTRAQYQAAYEDFKNTWGQVVNKILIPVLQIVTKIFNIMTAGLRTIAGLTGKTVENAEGVSSSIGGAVDNQNDLTDAVKETAKAQERSLAGFDKINKLTEENASASSGASGGGAGVGDISIPDMDYDNSFVDQIDKDLATIMGTVGIALVAVGLILLFHGNIAWGIGFIIAGASTVGAVVASVKDTDMANDVISVLSQIMGAVGGAMVAVGIIMIMLGSTAVGVGLIVSGASMLIGSVGSLIAFDVATIENVLKTITAIAGGAMLAIGIMLCIFSGPTPVSIGLIVAGATALATTVALNFDAVSTKIKEVFNGIMEWLKTYGLIVLGVVLCFSGIGIGYGISFIRKGASNLAELKPQQWQAIKEKMSSVFDGLMKWLKTYGLLILGVVLCFSGIGIGYGITMIRKAAGNLVELQSQSWNTIVTKVKDTWKKIKTYWDNNIAKYFTKAWWSTLAKNVANGFIGGIEGMINGCINGFEKMINWIVKALNKIHFDVPDWVPSIGGKRFGFNLKTVDLKNVAIPRLAQGAVIPPNREFLAVLGDQKSGTNIETPLKTMIEAFNIALNQRAESTGGEQNIVVYIDSDVIFKTVIKKNRNYTIATGVNPLGV